MEAAGKVVSRSLLPPALDFLGEEVACHAAPGSSTLVLPPHLPHPTPLQILALLPTSISLVGWDCKGWLWLRAASNELWHHHGREATSASAGDDGEGWRASGGPCLEGSPHLPRPP